MTLMFPKGHEKASAGTMPRPAALRAIRLGPVVLAILALHLVVAAPAAPAQQPAPQRPSLPPGIAADYDVKYVADGESSQTLDVFFPEKRADKSQPLLIWIHGGGWSGGSKKQLPYLNLNQLPRGYILASIEYRFSRKAIFPAQIQDCQAAIRWLRARAAKYNIDPSRIGVGGESAGGHLAALVGVSGGKKAFPPIGGNEDQSDRVQAVCDFYGPTDFSTIVLQAEQDKNVKNVFKWNNGDPFSKLIGVNLGQDKQKCDAVSPVHYVSNESPPFLILHGDRDTLVPFAQSVEFADLLTKADVKVMLQRVPGAGHGGRAFRQPALARLTDAFFDKFLKGIDLKVEALPDEEVAIKQPGSTAK
jgi:acetyl esterase/lipase